MSLTPRRFGVAMFLLAIWLSVEAVAQAQFQIRTAPVFAPGVNPTAPFYNRVNPLQLVAPGVTQQQALYNFTQQVRAARTIPPYLLGYNPYPSPIISTGPVIPSPIVPGVPIAGGGYLGVPGANLYTPGVDPYGSNLYTPGMDTYGSGYANPYTPYVGSGGTLFGAADSIRAAGNLLNQQQQARLLYEQARQARLQTRKQEFDLQMYMDANRPTYTEIQARVAAQTVRRVQTNSNPAEINSGRALNILLDDLRRFPGKKLPDATSIDADVLRQMNVTSSFGSLGLLRDGSRIEFPSAFEGVVTPAQTKNMQTLLQIVMDAANTGKRVDPNVMRDLRGEMDRARDVLAKKINEIPTQDYLDAIRFFNDFDEARIALERGEAKNQQAWNKFASGGARTTQEVVDWMISHGLKFGPAARTDEAAYRAAYSFLAAHSVGMSAQYAVADAKE